MNLQKSIKWPILALFLLLLTIPLHAETIFAPGGIGYSNRSLNAYLLGMGGAGVALSDSLYLHPDNPAGWYSQGKTRFSFGIRLSQSKASSSLNSDKSDGFDLPGAAIAIPFYKSLGMGVVFQTLTTNSFLSRSEAILEHLPNDADTISYKVTQRNQGKGGLSRIGYSLAFKKNKLAAGIGADWYFGKLEEIWEKSFSDSRLDTMGQAVRKEISGFGIRLGALYSIRENWSLGISYILPVKLEADLIRRISRGTWSDEKSTLDFGLPSRFLLGTSYTRNRWRGNLDLEYALWSSTSRNWGEIERNWEYQDTKSLRLGIERLPLRGALDPILEKWIYRVGIHYDEHYLKADGNTVKDLGFSLGFGKPLKNRIGIVDLALFYDLRGNETDNGATEKYYGLILGWSMSERWFMRRLRK